MEDQPCEEGRFEFGKIGDLMIHGPLPKRNSLDPVVVAVIFPGVLEVPASISG